MDDERHDLYEQFYKRIVQYLVAKWGFSSEEARDLAQDVFVSVFKHMEHTTIVAFWPFLKTAAHNRAANEIRTRAIRRKSEGGSLDAIPDISTIVLRDPFTDEPPATPESEAVEHEQAESLRDAMLHLSPALRSCMLLRMRGKSYEEIARILQISVNAVKTRLRDAKKQLMDRLAGGR